MFAGTMIGVTLTFANVGGFLTPILTGFITDGNVIRSNVFQAIELLNEPTHHYSIFESFSRFRDF